MPDHVTESYMVIVYMNTLPYVHTLNVDSPEKAVEQVKHEKLSAGELERVEWIRAIKIGDIPEYS